MKNLWILFPLLLAACAPGGNNTVSENSDTLTHDTNTSPSAPDTVSNKTHANERFRDVSVNRITQDSFQITGKAQVFEATFSWIIEDGHNELQKGFQMTDAGAPEWGNFSFGVRAPKARENSTLHIVLFESSPKDGSRQYELAVPLY